MISLETKRYHGKHCLVIRYWDGIDQPDFTPVLDISEEEMGWVGGRFKNCSNRYFREGEAIDLFLKINGPDEFSVLIEWVSENIKNVWAVDIESAFLADCWKFSFTNENDAVLFRLTWNAATDKYGAVR